MPRGLPATAAALNESSIAVGTRVGIVLVTVIVAETALATYPASVVALPADEAQRAISTSMISSSPWYAGVQPGRVGGE